MESLSSDSCRQLQSVSTWYGCVGAGEYHKTSKQTHTNPFMPNARSVHPLFRSPHTRAIATWNDDEGWRCRSARVCCPPRLNPLHRAHTHTRTHPPIWPLAFDVRCPSSACACARHFRPCRRRHPVACIMANPACIMLACRANGGCVWVSVCVCVIHMLRIEIWWDVCRQMCAFNTFRICTNYQDYMLSNIHTRSRDGNSSMTLCSTCSIFFVVRLMWTSLY